MMEKYTLFDLLMVLCDQRNRRFQGINVILEVFENDAIEPMRKKYMIISGLRGLGLYEIGYDGPKPKETKGVSKRVNGKIKGEIVPAELFRCHLMNAIVQFDFILN